jgi:demethylmenaquinone methyltransferase/2-methoxy-6-polyprenyl-1,4-benzoquinol methylase
MPSFNKAEHVHGVFSSISEHYDLMNDLESLGLHRLWKARLVHELSEASPQVILDIACGTGDIALALAQANPSAEVYGLDFCEEMLAVARQRAATELPLTWTVVDGVAQHSNNLHLLVGDALALPFADESLDAVSISFGLRNMTDYAAVLAEVYRVLRPGGRFCCLEASYPEHALVRPPFKLYFKYWLPVLGGLITNSPEEYAWLNTSTEAFLTKSELASLMQEVGFAAVSYTSLLLGAAALHRGRKISV